MSINDDMVAAERIRIQAEYQRRTREQPKDRYAPWEPAPLFMHSGRKRVAARLLLRAGLIPLNGGCLEIGFGSIGWLADLISWGVSETDLHGIELNQERVDLAKGILPQADLRVGDATALPWDANSFQLVIASTVFTSILNDAVRRIVAGEIVRVLAPGGALLWYDFAFNNPRNPHVLKVDRRDLEELFPQLTGEVKSVTLAPPLSRFFAPRSTLLASVFEAIPFLRTHLIGVLKKSL